MGHTACTEPQCLYRVNFIYTYIHTIVARENVCGNFEMVVILDPFVTFA